MADYVLETKKLTKKYGEQKAVDEIAIHVPKGAVYGLIGKNGAGKSTFMKMICGMANPTEGEIILFGDKEREILEGKTRVSALIENPGVYANMSVYDNIKLKAIAMGVEKRENLDEIIDMVGLTDAKKKKGKQLSLGMRQRLGIALALVGNPDFLILDEPINGLDAQGIIEMRRLIDRLNRERQITIMISSHILEELYKVVTHIGIIHKGNLLLELSKEELDHKCEKKVKIVAEDVEKVAVCLENMGITNYTIDSDKCVYAYECNERVQEMIKTFTLTGVLISEISVQNSSLEEFFLQVTEGSISV